MISLLTALEFINQGISVFNSLNGKVDGTSSATPEMIQKMLSSSTDTITQMIIQGNEQVIEKLEQDKMETLASRIRNIEMLIRMQERDQLFSYLPTVQESVDYAHHRYLEGKQSWFIPYLVGRSVVLAAFSHLGNIDQESIDTLTSELKGEIYKLLDQVVELCLTCRTPIPWPEIESTLTLSEGGIEQLLRIQVRLKLDALGIQKFFTKYCT